MIFLLGFYGPFKNISLMSSRPFIKVERKPENTWKKITWPSVCRTWVSHMSPERGSNHNGERHNGLRVNSYQHSWLRNVMSRYVRKDHMRPAKIQISLHIRAIWPESSMGAFWIANDAKFLHAENGLTGWLGEHIRWYISHVAVLMVPGRSADVHATLVQRFSCISSVPMFHVWATVYANRKKK